MLIASLLACAALAQTPTSGLPRTDFSRDTGGWTSVGPSGKISLARDVLAARTAGSLKFEYAIAKGGIEALVLQTQEAPLGKMGSLRFWVRPDHDTALALFLQETDGGRYGAAVSARKDVWQLVELSPSDFVLSDGPDDPIDPNGRLDLSLVAGIGIADFKQMIAQGADELVNLFGVQLGPHVLYLGDFMASEAALPPAWSRSDKVVRLDTLERPQPAWIGAGRASLSLERGGPIVGKALKLEYSVGAGSIAGMLRPFQTGLLAGMDRLEFSVASREACTLLVQLEERHGGKYNFTLDAAGGSVSRPVELRFAEFDPADDSRDDDGRLDLDEVKQVVVIDVTGLLVGKTQPNTLWVGPMTARAGTGR